MAKVFVVMSKVETLTAPSAREVAELGRAMRAEALA
jgi:hypothetical protein